MVNLNSKKKFYCLVTLAALLILFIQFFSETPRVLSNGEFSSLLEKVRTLGIKERMTEVRRIRTNSRSLKDDLAELIGFLEENVDNRGDTLTTNQQISAIESLANAGREASGATFIIKKLMLESESSKLKKTALLTLLRIKSSEESVLEVLNDVCTDTKSVEDKELCGYRSLVKHRFEVQPEVKENRQYERIISDLSDEIIKLIPEDNESKSDFSDFVFSADQKEVFYQASLIGLLRDDAKDGLYKIAASTDPLEKRILALETLLDQVDLAEDLVTKISDLMQYDVKYEIREAALLGLSRIDSERGLTQVHAYGHKFLHGEARPAKIEPHPFIKWALKNGIK